MKLSPLIEIEELFQIYQSSQVRIFDASNDLNSKIKYSEEHLFGAIFLDINNELSAPQGDFSKGGRHPLPDIHLFSETLAMHGISPDTHVVIYDHQGGANAAARFWWMLKSVGHEKVQVLNGGFQYAKKSNFPCSEGWETLEKQSPLYPIKSWKLPTSSISEVEKFRQNPQYLVVDVRSQERFEGIIEPVDLVAGHIPGAINDPYSNNLDSDGRFKKSEILRKKYQSVLKNYAAEKVIFHCGSGVTACHSILALEYAGLEIPSLFVGSWSEWSRNQLPVQKGK